MKRLLLASLVLLAGCKIEMEVPIQISDLDTTEVISKPLSVLFEVLTCDDYDDTRKESDDLIELKTKIKSNLPIAKYEQCFSKEMDSFAEFKVPFAIVPTNYNLTKEEEEKLGLTNIAILHSKRAEVGNTVTMYILKPFKRRLMALEQEYTTFTPRIKQILTNNTGNRIFYFSNYPAYINGVPFTTPKGVLNSGERKTVGLSDVSSEVLLENGNDNNWSILIGDGADFNKLQTK